MTSSSFARDAALFWPTFCMTVYSARELWLTCLLNNDSAALAPPCAKGVFCIMGFFPGRRRPESGKLGQGRPDLDESRERMLSCT